MFVVPEVPTAFNRSLRNLSKIPQHRTPDQKYISPIATSYQPRNACAWWSTFSMKWSWLLTMMAVNSSSLMCWRRSKRGPLMGTSVLKLYRVKGYFMICVGLALIALCCHWTNECNYQVDPRRFSLAALPTSGTTPRNSQMCCFWRMHLFSHTACKCGARTWSKNNQPQK